MYVTKIERPEAHIICLLRPSKRSEKGPGDIFRGTLWDAHGILTTKKYSTLQHRHMNISTKDFSKGQII